METSVERVIYDNEIAKWKFRGALTAVEANLWAAVLCKAKDIENKEIKVNLKEIAVLANYDLNNRKYAGLKNDAKSMAKKVANLVVEAAPTDKYFFHQFVVFQSFKITNDYELIIKVADDYVPYFNRLKKNFSTYEVGNIVHLKSEYSKEIYRILMAEGFDERENGKWKKNGYKIFKISINDLRERLEIPTSYRVEHIRKKILDRAIRELTTVNILGVAPFTYFEYLENPPNEKGAKGARNIELTFKFTVTKPRTKKDLELAKAIEEESQRLESKREVIDIQPEFKVLSKKESNNKQIPYKASLRCHLIVEDILQKMLEKHSTKKVYDWYGHKAVQLETIVTKYYSHYVYGDTQEELQFNEDKYKAMLASIYYSSRRQQVFENNLAESLEKLTSLEVRDPLDTFLTNEYDLLQFAKNVQSTDELKQIYSNLKTLVTKDNVEYCESIFAQAFYLSETLKDELMFFKFKEICIDFDIHNYKSIKYGMLQKEDDFDSDYGSLEDFM